MNKLRKVKYTPSRHEFSVVELEGAISNAYIAINRHVEEIKKLQPSATNFDIKFINNPIWNPHTREFEDDIRVEIEYYYYE
jgi:hypothetical protein